MKTVPIIACDFIDSKGRSTSFQLCRESSRTRDRLEAIAVVNFDDDKVTRCLKIESLKASPAAIVRLARRYKARSIPQVFRHA